MTEEGSHAAFVEDAQHEAGHSAAMYALGQDDEIQAIDMRPTPARLARLVTRPCERELFVLFGASAVGASCSWAHEDRRTHIARQQIFVNLSGHAAEAMLDPDVEDVWFQDLLDEQEALNDAPDMDELLSDCDACCVEMYNLVSELFAEDLPTPELARVLNYGRRRAEYAVDLNPVERLHYLDHISIKPEFRGYGIGLAAIATYLQCFVREYDAVVMYPGPEDKYRQRRRESESEIESGRRRLQQYWSQLGFRRVGRSIIFARPQKLRIPTTEEVAGAYQKRCRQTGRHRRRTT